MHTPHKLLTAALQLGHLKQLGWEHAPATANRGGVQPPSVTRLSLRGLPSGPQAYRVARREAREAQPERQCKPPLHYLACASARKKKIIELVNNSSLPQMVTFLSLTEENSRQQATAISAIYQMSFFKKYLLILFRRAVYLPCCYWLAPTAK